MPLHCYAEYLSEVIDCAQIHVSGMMTHGPGSLGLCPQLCQMKQELRTHLPACLTRKLFAFVVSEISEEP